MAANVLPAWSAGAVGSGVVAALLDSGIAADSPEFAGRIHPASRDVTGSGRGIQDEAGHGTSVAGVMAAARNGAGIVGIAPEVQLAVFRADRPGSCASADGCRYPDSALAAGIDAAIAARARVVNLSLGGSEGASPELRAAFARAAAAGLVIVISAGNDARATVDGLARAALAAGGRGAVLIAGAATQGRAIADFSNRAGDAADNFVLALGERVRSFNHRGEAFLYSGTSYSAPQVAGAIALLAQAFPQLSAAQLVDIVLRSADDIGAPGTDPVHGVGILNIGRAFQPIGPTSLAGTSVPVSTAPGGNGQMGAAMGGGEATGAALGTVPVADAFGRIFALRVADTLRPAAPGRLAARITGAGDAGRLAAAGAGPLLLLGRAPAAASASADPFRFSLGGSSHLGFARAGLDAQALAARPPVSARLALGPVTLRLADGPGAAVPRPGVGGPAGLVAADGLLPAEDLARRAIRAAAAEVALGRLVLGAATSRGGAPAVPGRSLAPAEEIRTAVSAGWAQGPVAVLAEVAGLRSEGAFLGARTAPAIGLAGGRGLEAGGALVLALGPFDLRVAGRHGWHRPRLAGTGLLRDSGETIATAAWSAAASAPLRGGRLHAALAQPEAVTEGALVRAGLAGLGGGVRVPLAPPAREQAFEIGWAGPAGALGQLSLGAFHRADAGHVEGLADTGGWIGIARRF